MTELRLDATVEYNRAISERNGIALGACKAIEREEALIADLTRKVEYLDKYAQQLEGQLTEQAKAADFKSEQEKLLREEITKLHAREADLKAERAELVREVWMMAGHEPSELPDDPDAMRAFIAQAQREE